MKHTVPCENSVTFTENRHGIEVLKVLQKQRELERFCDIVFLVGDKQFHAHRCIVVAFSPYLDSILKARKIVTEQFTISYSTYEAFESLLVYMYSGIVKISKENIAELLKLANKFHMEQLKNYCAEYLERILNSRNCLTICEMSCRYGFKNLENLVCSYIEANLCEVMEGEEIMNLSLPKLENFLQNTHWKIKNEELLSLITYWVYHDVTPRESNYRCLLAFVSWNDIYPQAVSQLINGHPLFSVSETCLSFILDVLKEEHLLKNPTYDNLHQLKETLNQNVKTLDDNDKFIDFAVSNAIHDQTFLNRDKNLESLFNEANMDRYLLEKDFNWKPDIISQDIQNVEICNGEIMSQNLEAEQCQIDYQGHNRHHKLIHESSEYLSNVEKPKDFDADYCNYYSCPNDFTLGMEDFQESETHSRNAENTEGSNASKSGAIILENSFQLYDAKKNVDSVNHSCCHYSHENSENCPTITNKKSYMNHKYQINHPSDNCDILLHKKGHHSFNDHTLSNSVTGNLRFKIGNGAKEEISGVQTLSKPTASSEKCDEYKSVLLEYHGSNSSIECPATSSLTDSQGSISLFSLERKEIGESGSCEKISENEILSALHDNESYTCVSKDKTLQPEFLCIDNSQQDYPKDMSLSHSNCLTERQFDICDAIGSFSSSNEDEMKIVSLSNTCINKELQLTHDTKNCSTISVLPFINSNNADEAKEIKEEIISNLHAMNEQSKTVENRPSNKSPESQTNVASKQTMKQKVMQKYREGWQKCNTNSSNEHEESQIFNENTAPAGEKVMKKDDCVDNDCKKKISDSKESNPIKPKFNDSKMCDVCEMEFDLKKPYFIHMKEHFSGPPHKCDSCTATFQRIYHLLDHRLTHTSNKPFKCLVCSFTTSKMSNLKDHMMGHNDNAKPFQCTICGKRFCRKQHLDKHYTKHTKDRPFICDTCGWTGKTKDTLLLHSKVHSGDLFSCQYSDCAYRTAKMSHMKEHTQYHSKSRPFSCDSCSLRFMTNSHLLRHKRIHNEQNRSQCPHCDYATPRIDLLKIHIKRLHSCLKQPTTVKQRKPQLKKKDAMVPKHTLSESYSQYRPSDDHFQQFPIFSDIGENCTACMESTLTHTNLNYSIPTSTPSSCTFDTNDDPDDALMIASEIEGSVRHPLSPYSHSSYLEQSISDGLDCDESQNQYSLPFKNSFSYSMSNMD